MDRLLRFVHRRQVNCDAASRNEPPVPPSSVSLGYLGFAATARDGAVCRYDRDRSLTRSLRCIRYRTDVADAARNSDRPSRTVLIVSRPAGQISPATTGRLEIKRFLPPAS